MPLLRLLDAHGRTSVGVERLLVLNDEKPPKGVEIDGDRIGIDGLTVCPGNVRAERRDGSRR